MELYEVLSRAQGRRFLGPRPLSEQLTHAQAFSRAIADVLETLPADGPAIDIGSGAGVPGLVCAMEHRSLEWVFIEAAQSRADFLRWAVGALELRDTVTVLHAAAEDVGRDGEVRERARLVTARSFGSPAVTAECAAPLLTVGGMLVVSEPPAVDPSRWPDDGLVSLGLAAHRRWRNGAHLVGFVKQTPSPDAIPRRQGIPAKRPLF